MNRITEQNKRFYALLALTHLNKDEIVQTYTGRRTKNSSEMSEEEMDACLEYLQAYAEKMQKSRRRIFSRIRSIKLIHADDKLSEADVMRYIRNIVGLKLPDANRLNDYTLEELRMINRKLDAIKPKQEKKYRKSLKIG